MRVRRALRKIESDGNNPIHTDKPIPGEICKMIADFFTWADIPWERMKDDPAIPLIARLQSGLNERHEALTYGEAALYVDFIVELLDDHFRASGWAPDSRPARQQASRSQVTEQIEKTPDRQQPIPLQPPHTA